MFPYKVKNNIMGSHQLKPDGETFLPYKLGGIMTVECSIVLPIFIFLIISILSVIRLITLNVEVDADLLEKAKEIAQYSYVTEQNNTGNDDMVDVFAYYSYDIPFNFFNLGSINNVSRARVKKWTGYDISNDISNEKMVYVTNTGSVYHTEYDCTHLNLSIKSVSAGEVGNMRNVSNCKYHKCELCGEKGELPGIVYITDEGNSYHFSIGCSGLKRSIMEIPISKVGDRRICSRCNKRAGD